MYNYLNMASLKYFCLLVIIAPVILGSPTVQVSSRTLKVLKGEKATVHCENEDAGEATVVWTRENAKEFGTGTTTKLNALIISKVEDSDAGTYVCTGSVGGAAAFTENIKLEIVEDLCELQNYEGDCRAMHPRWFYDSTQKKCRKFFYGGCDGNKNNFKTEEECRLRCVKA